VVAVVWIIAVVIPALNRGHNQEDPLRLLPGRADLLAAAVTIGAANAFG